MTDIPPPPYDESPPDIGEEPDFDTTPLPSGGGVSDREAGTLSDFIASKFFGFKSYSDVDTDNKSKIRIFLKDFYEVALDIDNIHTNIENDLLTDGQRKVLELLATDPAAAGEFIKSYINIIDYKGFGGALDNDKNELRGYKLLFVIDEYKRLRDIKNASDAATQDPYDYIQQQIDQMGEGFQPYFDYLDSDKQIRNIFLRPGKFRNDTGPAPVNQYQCRIGGSTFFVPPTSINVHQGFKAGSISNGVIRQPNSPKMNLGHSETSITLTLYFPTHETMWGFKGDTGKDLDIFNWDPQPLIIQDRNKIEGQIQIVKRIVSDQVIDSYLASLRGLITQFKYSPILPIKNEYLNRTFNIDAVALMGMTVSTIPNFPFAVVVNIELARYNYAPLMPMISNFDQAIHWGKFRQYMGRASARLDAKVNQGFLIEKTAPPISNNDVPHDLPAQGETTPAQTTGFEGDLIPRFDKVSDIVNGRNFAFYYPVSDPARIFAPDTTDFRQPGEDQVVTNDDWDFILKSIGLDVVESPKFNFFEYDRTWRANKYRNEAKVLQQWLKANRVVAKGMDPAELKKFIDEQITAGRKAGTITDSNEQVIRDRYQAEWFFTLYGLMLEEDPSLKAIRDSRNTFAQYSINEWEVPMEKLDVDWRYCIVSGVSVSLSNNFAKLQVQLQDEPTYQHIGGGDSTIEVDMIIIGEDNLIKFRRMFDHINGLARIEKAHGVLGFLGIKNILTSLCGIKYVLPLDFETDTIPNFPHVYSVKMSFIDFDIMQKEREKLSSEQQAELIDIFGKRNPFLRLKQCWGVFNAYPDFPLDVRDETGRVVGHLDPDWYFRSFNTTNSDKDIFTWNFDPQAMKTIQDISQLQFLLSDPDVDLDPKKQLMLRAELTDLETQLRTMIEHDGAQIPSYWKIKNGKLVREGNFSESNLPEPEMTIYLGVYNKDKTKASILSLFEGGYLAVGTEETKTKDHKREYSMGMSYLREDRASENLNQTPKVDGIVPYSEYQQEYLDGAQSPNQQYQAIMMDYNYRNIRGRMLRAFPTYMLWLIDEGGRFAGIKMFDNFYGINSVIDFSVLQSEDPLEDTLILRLSNIYGKLTTPYRNEIITEEDPLYETPIGQWIRVAQDRERNLESGLTDKLVEINNIRLKPGVRIHLRAGYSANPNALQTVFNGVITEVEPGDIMTITAQADAVEFSGMVNTTNSKGSSGKLDGGLGGGMSSGFWLSEPRDLIVRLLSMGASNFKEWFAWGSKGVFFSESRFGIRHFGSILYEPMTSSEGIGIGNQIARVNVATQSTSDPSAYSGILGPLSGITNDLASTIASANLGSLLNGNLMAIGQMLWVNSFAKRDYEIFKRNIYPGNGSGIAQYMGGDQIDAGITVSSAITYYQDETGQNQASLKLITNDLAGQTAQLTQQQISILQNATDANEKASEAVWSVLRPSTSPSSNGGVGSGGGGGGSGNWSDDPAILDATLSDEQTLDVMSKATSDMTDLTITTGNDTGGSMGILDVLLSPFKFAYSGLNVVNDFVDAFVDQIPILKSIPGASFLLKGVIPGGSILQGVDIFHGFKGLVGGIGRLASAGNPLGHVLGLAAPMEDDDLHGFDEVSFRAQTYMKSVWDLFQLCSALLPNYIVAVRPFEDRSTLFYGKPHWLYTSGVIPVTLGIPKDQTIKPLIEEADKVLHALLDQASKAATQGAEQMNQVVDQTKELKDIMSFVHTADFDPNNIPGSSDLGVPFTSQADIDVAIGQFQNDVPYYEALKQVDFTGLPINEINRIINDMYSTTRSEEDPEITKNATETLKREISEALDKLKKNQTIANSGLDLYKNHGEDVQQFINSGGASQQVLTDFVNRDPITFAYQFGWKFSSIPVWIDPMSGYGVDKVGDAAAKLFWEDFTNSFDALSGDRRSLKEANDIWETLRKGGEIYNIADTEINSLNIVKPAQEIFTKYFPVAELSSKFEDVWELFLRFLWQDPYNRAWVVITIDKNRRTVGNVIDLTGDHSNRWNWSKVLAAWETFISSKDAEVDEDRLVNSAATSSWMKANAKPGKDASNTISGFGEDVKEWFDKNIGQVLGLITDTIGGFLTSIRLSLSQVSNALSMVGTYQKQANILNAALNDSIYYQMGNSPTDLLRLVDNPFTREYGEPVIEIREPFQRVHFASSFDNILSNGVKENLSGVYTVVTALTDGKHPVTVHFDKGVSPERQTEKTVETGLLWDNAVGNGLFGFLQPLLHPLETLRAFSKIATGSSDELSARRVALWHMRESLKDIYTGELLLLGDPDIRPHDLLYMADAYERMYGMVEVEKVIHHFTPETGFVTAVTPNALVTINDPVRWSLLSYMYSKFSNYNMRDDMRAYLGITTDRAISSATQEISSQDIYKNFSTQMHGAIQYTQGNSAIVRDVGAIVTSGGVKSLSASDETITINNIAKIDIGLGIAKMASPILGGLGGLAVTGGSPAGAIGGGVAAWAVSDLIWEGWQWVKNNLLDQHGCYIQYLNKDGQPMDAGLSYFQGVAVGTNHTLKLLPSVLGLTTGQVTVKEDGHYRITTNDLLGALGWTEYETVSLYRDSSIFVNEINTKILKIAGRTAENIPNNSFITLTARIFDPNGENVRGQSYIGVEDGDTLHAIVLDSSTNDFVSGQVLDIRLSVVNTYELQYHDLPETPDFNEADFSQDTDLGKLAYNYLAAKFSNFSQRIVGLRIDKRNKKDKYGRVIAMVFHNVPLSVPGSDRRKTLLNFVNQFPPIPFDSYLPDGRPYTLNWEMIMTGYGNVDMRESLWATSWRNAAIDQVG